MKINLKTIKKVYINLDNQTQNKKNIEKHFSVLNYENFERFSGVLLPKKRGFNPGCTTSHNRAMKAHRNNIPLLLMEDDCRPTVWYSDYVNDGMLEIPDDSDAVYLGFSMANHTTFFKASSINEKWMRVESVLATHAILFLNNSIDKFIENSDSTLTSMVPLDNGYATDVLPKLKVYAPKKAIFFQDNHCFETTNIVVEPELNKWISYKTNNTINYERNIR